LVEALRWDAANILAGRWKFFGHIELNVDDPPRWHRDYLVGRDLPANESAFSLDHRQLAGGADIKLIWELSRWHQLVRLAMAAYVVGDKAAAEKCVAWLEDWVRHNPPYRGWNWISALEAGIRIIQFTWMDALLGASRLSPEFQARIAELRRAILPAHVWFAWRYKSFGSSANNHLLGELGGCIVALSRWPALSKWCAPLTDIQQRWEREVFRQFSPDGGNREQALNYHLFSWELCWQAFTALEAHKLSHGFIYERLVAAARFFREIQHPIEPWDYGDSDNGFVVPFFEQPENAAVEWRQWFEASDQSPSIAFWLGNFPRRPEVPLKESPGGDWLVFPDSGIGVCRSGPWHLRWDLSPLGYLSTAAHGHLDALHLSVWLKDVALIVDPGTGAYYADAPLRTWLASRAAHNGPCPHAVDNPARRAPFLWESNHSAPLLSRHGERATGQIAVADRLVSRTIETSPDRSGWVVEDRCIGPGGEPSGFSVCWQFAPGTIIQRLDERRFLASRNGVELKIEASAGWSEVLLVSPAEGPIVSSSDPVERGNLDGLVSSVFRRILRAPFLKFDAKAGNGPGGFMTTLGA
jgi:hypothetical protein